MSGRRVIPLATRPAAVPAAPVEPRLALLPPLALYVHFPWCLRKCPYCDFNSHAVRGEIPEGRYLDALVRDLEQALPAIWGRRVTSVFIGGGTPSLISPEGLERLLADLRMRLKLLPEAEITLEANPGTVEAARFAAYRAAGVTRISLGIQSFDDAQLAALGRIHDSREARAAIEIALANFEEVNLDLMYALPRQSLAEAERDIVTALSYGTPHLSCYQLTLEPNTPFHRAPPPLPDDDAAGAMQDLIEARLAAAGYQHYEISAWARPGHRCRHNLNYWSFGDYLGIGAGAHGKLSSPAGIRREMRPRHPSAYLEAVERGAPVAEVRAVPAAELPFEFMMNALRLRDGFPRALFAERTGLPFETVEPTLVDARRRGLIEVDADIIRPSERGRRFLNDVLQLFLA